MKLEIKHIAPYLPYGLMARIEDYKRDYVGVEIDKIKGMYLFYDIWHFNTNRGLLPSIKCIKPILRPLSDFTKEIEVDGKKFIPIQKLYDIVTGCEWSNTNMLIDGSSTGEWWTGLVNKHFGYNSEKQYFYHLGCDLYYKVNHQLTLFNKLREWHFDIDDLIENNLAIDINTLEK